jgi:hypothetical protein
MGAFFTPRANLLARGAPVAGVLLLGLVGFVWYGWVNSPYGTRVGYYVWQPVPFSHAHHVGDDGIDCRYCHATAEVSSFAGMPSTETCMHCHSQLWTNAEMLAPVRESWRTDVPLVWNRVHDLADFVFFNHAVHVNNGVGCVTCHGRVDRMPLITKSKSLYMEWCLECHRNPAPYLRPRDQIYSLTWEPPEDHAALAAQLIREYEIDAVRGAALTNCSACHR